MLESYGVEGIATTVKNPQANLVERVYQILGNILRTQDLQNVVLDKNDPFTDVLCKYTWVIYSTIHTTLKLSLA